MSIIFYFVLFMIVTSIIMMVSVISVMKSYTPKKKSGFKNNNMVVIHKKDEEELERLDDIIDRYKVDLKVQHFKKKSDEDENQRSMDNLLYLNNETSDKFLV